MRPFNLEEAKAGKPVCTRDGKDARIICFDMRNPIYQIVALIDDKAFYNTEIISLCTKSGTDAINGEDTRNDLFMKTEKKEGWVNVYEHPEHESFVGSKIFESEESAKMAALKNDGYRATTKIEWEE